MATAGMTAEENKTVLRRYIEEAWNRHNIDATDELVSPEYLNHAASAEYQRAGVKYSLNWLFSVFPAHRFDIEDAVAEGGKCSGTHEGELLGTRLRASVSPSSRCTGSVLQTARWPSIGRSGTTWA